MFERAGLVLALAGALAPGALRAQRAPVLKQIDVPHPYYYREMYLPQLTSGPSSVAWSPDGSELVFSMQGSLWRQRVGSDSAVELTDGPGYDYQPDWSPDGRTIVYTSYQNDALELWALDLPGGGTHRLIGDGAVNLDPRWSPDGSRIAFVSTALGGRWQVYLLPMQGGQAAGAPVRVTEEFRSNAPRYYYSPFDHYLSPAWSPDGRELVLVSNKDQVWGSGGIWRMEARTGAPMREIRNEETTWKVHPDWAPDGKRVVYSSYLGGQRNQLWLTTAQGGDPFQLTYCDCDHTVPRWSPDGNRIAFISNAPGTLSIQIVSVPGGRTETILPTRRRFLHPHGVLRLSVTDSAGRRIPARVSVTGADGRGLGPDGAMLHADDGFDRSLRRREPTYFHASGPVELSVPAGRYTVLVSHGFEYRSQSREVTVAADTPLPVQVRMSRLLDLPSLGWWSGDLHVHMNYGGVYRMDVPRLRAQAEAEDLHLVENLIVNKEQRIPDISEWRPGGRPDPRSTAATLIRHDEEYHTSYWGHSGHLGLTDHLILPGYAGYANTAAASLFPDNGTVFELSHAQSGLSGYVHPFDEEPDPEATAPLTHALPVEVALGLVDYLEVLGFSDHLATAKVWYRLLNTGFRIPAGAGTDAMTNYASLHGPLGLNRVFVHAGPRLDYTAWLAGLKAGHTFASNGPLLRFSVNGKEPGDELRFPDGVHQLTARVSLRSNVPVERLEIVANGVVVARIPLGGDSTRAEAIVPLPVTRSGWFTLRAWSSHSDPGVLDWYPFATTSPVYVTVAGRPVRSPEDARYFVRWIERLETAASNHTGWNTPAEKQEVLDRLARARQVFREMLPQDDVSDRRDAPRHRNGQDPRPEDSPGHAPAHR